MRGIVRIGLAIALIFSINFLFQDVALAVNSCCNVDNAPNGNPNVEGHNIQYKHCELATEDEETENICSDDGYEPVDASTCASSCQSVCCTAQGGCITVTNPAQAAQCARAAESGSTCTACDQPCTPENGCLPCPEDNPNCVNPITDINHTNSGSGTQN